MNLCWSPKAKVIWNIPRPSVMSIRKKRTENN